MNIAVTRASERVLVVVQYYGYDKYGNVVASTALAMGYLHSIYRSLYLYFKRIDAVFIRVTGENIAQNENVTRDDVVLVVTNCGPMVV